MKNIADIRIKTRISTGELERRWKAVRQAMKENSLDFLIMQNHDDVLGGYIKWFTDLFAYHDYTATVIFPREDDMITIFHGPDNPDRALPPVWAVRGAKKRISVPAIPSLDFSKYFMAEKAVEELKDYKNSSIGFVGTSFITAAFYNYVTKHLPGAKFSDATDLVDNIKAIKSPEEIELLKKCASVQDEAFNYMLTRVRPGMTENDVYNECANKCKALGTTQINFMGSSAQPGKAAGKIPPSFGNKVIEDGDQVALLLETNGPGGVWTELLRIICLGEVTAELKEQFALAQELQKVTLDLLRPGVEARAIWEAGNAFLRSKGYPEESRISVHGAGYDMVERPGICSGETMKIQANMCMAVHPTIVTEKAAGMVCENYIVRETGSPVCLHKTPQEIFQI